MTKKVVVTIDQMGNPVIEAIGFNGQGCASATKSIEQALAGSGGVETTYKDEWASGGGCVQEGIKQTW